MSNIEIIQIEDNWFVVTKCLYDEEFERSILGAGKSKEDALIMAIEHAAKVAESSYEVILEVAKVVGGDPDVEGLGQYVKLKGVLMEYEGQYEEKLGAICYDEETSRWMYYWR